MTFHAVMPLDDLVDGIPQQIRLNNRTLVLVRLDTDVYVLDDRCSHEDFSLAEGEVDGDEMTIECARHGALFSLVDGEAVTFPATRPVASYATRLVNGVVEVDL
ncbi:MAG: Rieske 2Fe-2S domain-containing protein [Acidobacteria bacterium]|nr:Rieske 2Fe-2S domain-containing protein [Acidobacteriota bacterium]